MKKSTFVSCILFLYSPFLWAQVQYVLPVGSAKSGAITAVANDWEVIGVNPANLGWDNNDKISFTVINPGVSVQAGALNMKAVNLLRHGNDSTQLSTTRQIAGSAHGTNLFADINWFAFSLKLNKIGTFAIGLRDKAMLNVIVSPAGTTLITQNGHVSDSVALHKLVGSSVSLYQYREMNIDFGRKLFETGGQKTSNDDYYVNYNVRYSNYIGQGNVTDTAPGADSDAFKVYGGIGLKYIWGETYFNGNVDNSGINADYAVPSDFPAFSPLSAANPGHGLAADLGVSALYKKWTFGISATDLGSVTWRQSSFTIADTTIFGLNNINTVINKIDSNTVTDYKRTRNVTMLLASKLRLGSAYQLSKRIILSADIIFPLNNAISNLNGPYFALGTQISAGKVLILNAGIATTADYGTSVPLGISLCAGHAVQMYFGTNDVLTFLGKNYNGNISAAYGLIRINIRGRKKDAVKN